MQVRPTLAGLTREPTFAAGAIVSLGLGVALATSVFGVIDVLSSNVPPFADSGKLVAISVVAAGTRGGAGGRPMMSAQDVLIAQASPCFERVAAVVYDDYVLGRTGDAHDYAAARVSDGFFDLLRVRAAAGRLFQEGDDAPEAGGPIVISEALWRSRFGGGAGILGTQVLVDGVARTIIGVVPRNRSYPRGVAIWSVLPTDTLRSFARNSSKYFFTIARVRSGVTLAQATAQLASLLNGAIRDAGGSQRVGAYLSPLAKTERDAERDTIELWAAVALVILILSSVNFATMLLARGMQRRGELAVRSACGASFGRLLALLLEEATMLAAGGGVLAVVFSAAVLQVGQVALGDSLPQGALQIDPRIGAIAFLGATLAGVLVALLPALQLAKTDLRTLLSGESSRVTRSDREIRGRRGLVVLQIALAAASVAVIVSAVHAEISKAAGGPGFDYEDVVGGTLLVTDTARWSEAAFIGNVRAVDGVVAAAIARNHEIRRFRPQGAPPGVEPHVFWSDVTPEFLATMKPRLIAGRLPTAAEVNGGEPIAVLSERVLRWLQCDHCGRPRVIPTSETFVGRQLSIRGTDDKWHPLRVVGVVSDTRFAPDFDPVGAPVYTFNMLRELGPGAAVFVRARGGNRRTVMDGVSRSLGTNDMHVVVSDFHLLADDVARWHAESVSRLTLLGFLGALALALALIGVYGLTAYTAAMRTRELGIRLALGATETRVVRMIVGELWWMAGAGSVAGLMLAARVIPALDTYLRNPFAPNAVVTFPAIPALAAASSLIGIAVLGTLLPARRALRMDVARVVTGGA